MSEWKDQDFNALTVMELRKVAKAMGVSLGAGITKAGIVEKLNRARDAQATQVAIEATDNDVTPAETDSRDVAEENDPGYDEVEETEGERDTMVSADAPVASPVQVEVEETALAANAVNPAPRTDNAAETPVAQPARPPISNFRPAYQAPVNPRFGSKPAYQAPSTPYANRPPRPQLNNDLPRTQTVRPNNYTPRFGPAAQDAPRDDDRGYRSDVSRQTGGYWNDRRPAYGDSDRRPSYGDTGDRRPAYGDSDRRASYGDTGDRRPAYGDSDRRASYGDSVDRRPAYGDSDRRPSYGDAGDRRPAYGDSPRYARSYDSSNYDAGRMRAPQGYNTEPMLTTPNPTEMLSAAECQDGAGYLELHPDGYGFLRGASMLPSNRDVYISMAQVRRFSLRTGDHVVGKVRPQRDGDRYSAMLYITEINGTAADLFSNRMFFDDLTPCYPRQRMTLEVTGDEKMLDMRLIDLIAPIGFGQRGLIYCPPAAAGEKWHLLSSIANAVSHCHPDAVVMTLLLGGTPEDATQLRDLTNTQVISATFDQAPETQLRVTDLVLERAERLVEMKKDVILLVDNLTYLSKIYTTSAVQTGRQTIGMVNPASLQKAKRILGAARCVREGGSLTVFAMLNVETGNRVDDSIAEDLRGTANMELVLDTATARAHIYPPVNMLLSGTKHAELIASKEQLEGVTLVHEMLDSLRAVDMIPQLLSMLEKTDSNADLLVRIKDWAALMKQ